MTSPTRDRLYLFLAIACGCAAGNIISAWWFLTFVI